MIGYDKYKSRTGRHNTNMLDNLRADFRNAELGALRSGKRLRKPRNVAKKKKMTE